MVHPPTSRGAFAPGGTGGGGTSLVVVSGGGGTSLVVFSVAGSLGSVRSAFGRNAGAAAFAAASVSVRTISSDRNVAVVSDGRARVPSANGSATSKRLHTSAAGAQSSLVREDAIGASLARASRSASSAARAAAAAALEGSAEGIVSPGFSSTAPPPFASVSPDPLVNALESAARMRDRSPSAMARTSTDFLSGSLGGGGGTSRGAPGGGAVESDLAFSHARDAVVSNGVSPNILARSSASSGLGLAAVGSVASRAAAHAAASPAPAAISSFERANRHA